MSLRRIAITLTAVLAMLEFISTAAAETISTYWDDTALGYIHQNGYQPQFTVRTMAVMHAAMYDAWTAYDPIAVPSRPNGILKRPPEENTDSNKIEAISFAAHKVLVALMPSMASSIDTALAQLGYDLEDAGSADTATPAGLGNVAADAVIGFRQYDPPHDVAINKPDPNDDPNGWERYRALDSGLLFQQDAASSMDR